jgi:2,4-dienoyl-CoA reductase-like NADH-dependent reductase (Old Yellow Enzyme family)
MSTRIRHAVLNRIQIASLQLKNRAAVAPMTRVSATAEGVPTPLMVDYYTQFAKGGFGLIITEGTYTDAHYSRGYPRQPGMINDLQAQGWKSVVESVHRNDSKTIMQLMHAGALSQALEVTCGPSAIRPLRHKMAEYGGGGDAYFVPQEMTTADIQAAIEGFVDSALRAQATGFDGVEIHGANGYLVDQFLTSYTNRRTDQYGGSVEKRVRLATEIIAAVRANVKPNFIVGVRLSQGKVNDFDYRWPGGHLDAAIIFPAVAKAGAAYIHFASEGRGFHHGCYTDANESLPKLARDLTGLPIIANGGMHDEALSSAVINGGEADIVAIATGALANPDWPQKIARGLPIAKLGEDFFAKGVTLANTGIQKLSQQDECSD